MAFAALKPEERIALAGAVVLHVAIVAMLLLQPRANPPLKTPDRMTVTLVEEVGLQSTSPTAAQQSQAAVAPTISQDIGPPEESVELEPQETPAPPPPAPTPAKPEPKKPEPKKPAPTKPAPPKPAPAKPVPQKPAPKKPVPKKPAPAKPAPAKPAPAKPAPTKPAPAKPAPAKPGAGKTTTAKPSTSSGAAKPAATPATKPGGGTKLGDDFLKGANFGDSKPADVAVPAAQIGAQAQASLAQAIGRQLKPHWSSPQGVDAELLVTVLAFNLNRDGTLAGAPRVVSQSGITDANRAQAARHKELAIRAVQLAAPFDLPPQYYNGWKRVSAFRFDRKLSQ